MRFSPGVARVLRAAAAGLLSALLAWALVMTAPAGRGVALLSSERREVAAPAALVALLLSATLGAWARPSGWALAALLPPSVMVALQHAPRHGTLRPSIDDDLLIGGAVAALLVAAAARTRLAPAFAAPLAAMLVLQAALSAGPQRPVVSAPTGRPSHVLVITLDTLRADHLEFCGATTPAWTPNLSALARQSGVYCEVFAPLPLTGPSHSSMFSGVHVVHHGQLSNGEPSPPGLPWAPALFQAAGYRTVGVVSAAVLDASLGFDRGFDVYDSTFESRLERGHGVLGFREYRLRAGSPHQRDGGTTADLALQLVRLDQPSFTWVHLYDAHSPYNPSPEAAARVGLADGARIHDRDPVRPYPHVVEPAQLDLGRRLYRASIEDLDRHVGTLLAAFPPDTVVLVVGDHGESLGEHDYVFSHGLLPFAPDTRVPLLLRAPGGPIGRHEALASVTDVSPTLLSLAGLQVPEGLDGRPLGQIDPERVVLTLSHGSLTALKPAEALGRFSGLAVRQGQRTATLTQWHGFSTFFRDLDPDELMPLPAPSDDPLAVALNRILAEEQGKRPGPRTTPTEVDEALRALGYLGD